MSEKTEHKQVCEYIKLQYPHVIFNTDASGIKLTMGQAVQMKKLRSSRAFPDIIIYEPKKAFCGLFIEMKRTGERIYKKNGEPATEHIREQLEMIDKLNNKCYSAFMCVGYNHAVKVIDEYMNL
jgi:hypothetical protein